MSQVWDPDFAERSPIFAPLRGVARELRLPDWPGHDDLNRLLAARGGAIVNACGKPLIFVRQQARQGNFVDKFEPRIFLRGEAQFRPRNWHDLCNALVWLVFPRAKAALNQRHFRELERQRASGAPNRGPAQDALTLFDEGGVIVTTTEPVLGELLTGCEWKELFWRRRARTVAHMRFCLFGHALYEKALEPFAGMTGRGLIFNVAGGFPELPLARQFAELDGQLAARVADPARFLATRELAPVPILGVPGWCADNERAEYYDNAGYFRPRPAPAPAPGNG